MDKKKKLIQLTEGMLLCCVIVVMTLLCIGIIKKEVKNTKGKLTETTGWYRIQDNKKVQVDLNQNPQGSEKSKQLADHIQSALIKGLDPNNHREAKANAEYYLFRDNPYPIVIVECGFLSNPEELKALQDDGYQKKAVQCILDGIESYLADI